MVPSPVSKHLFARSTYSYVVFKEDTGIHAPSSKIPSKWHRRRLGGWLHSHLVPEGFRTAIEKKFGNFVIVRSVNRLLLKTQGQVYILTTCYRQVSYSMRRCQYILVSACTCFLVATIEAKVCLFYYPSNMSHVLMIRTVDNSNIMHALFLKETVRQGQYFTQPESVKQIPSFVQHYNIEMNDYVISDVNEYKNFNEFFTRAILPSKRPVAEEDDHVSPSRMCVCVCACKGTHCKIEYSCCSC